MEEVFIFRFKSGFIAIAGLALLSASFLSFSY